LNGSYYVMAIDDDKYVIIKICPFESNTSKYVPCECVQMYKNLNLLGASQICEKWVLDSWRLSVCPSVRIEQITSNGFKTKLICEYCVAV
jgi:hypothetical protein